MASKTVGGETAPRKRLRAKLKRVAEEAGEPVESHRSVGAVLKRCAEARAVPEPAEPQILPPLRQRRPRVRSPEACAKYIQREMSRALPQIWAMLLEETTKGKNLAALKLLLQVAVFYGGKPTAAAGAKARTAAPGFARRIVEEFRQRNASATATNDGATSSPRLEAERQEPDRQG